MIQKRTEQQNLAHVDTIRLATEKFRIVKNRDEFVKILEATIERIEIERDPVRSHVDVWQILRKAQLMLFQVRTLQQMIMFSILMPAAGDPRGVDHVRAARHLSCCHPVHNDGTEC